jgi:hypothetical protein
MQCNLNQHLTHRAGGELARQPVLDGVIWQW